jgi:cation transport regulator ChaC
MYYFAYGTNLNRQRFRTYCPESRPLFNAFLPNYKLIFAGWNRRWRGGLASLKLVRGERVRGAVYDLTDADLRRLDKNEGCPQESRRINVGVIDEDGNMIDAVTYVKVKQSPEAAPSREYLEIIRQGYRDWHIS